MRLAVSPVFAATFFFAPPRRRERERRRGFLSSACSSCPLVEDVFRPPEAVFSAATSDSTAGFFRRLGGLRRLEDVASCLRGSFAASLPRRRRPLPCAPAAGFLRRPESSPASDPASDPRPERCELFCSSLAGRLGLRVLLRVTFSPSPRVPSVALAVPEALFCASPRPEPEERPSPLTVDLVPCPRPPPDRLRRRGRESSPEDFSPVGFDLLREEPSLVGFDLLREEAGLSLPAFSRAAPRPAPNSAAEPPESFFSVFLRMAKTAPWLY